MYTLARHTIVKLKIKLQFDLKLVWKRKNNTYVEENTNREFQLELLVSQIRLVATRSDPNRLMKTCVQQCAPYADELISMNEEFDHRFQDFRSQESSLHMFSSPFDVNVEQAPEEFQLELSELQGNDDLKRDMKDYSLLEFYLRLPEKSFPKIKDLARKKMSLFGSTYICEQLFTKMKHTKSKTRSRLTDCHLENSLRVAASSIAPKLDTLVKKHQAQISH